MSYKWGLITNDLQVLGWSSNTKPSLSTVTGCWVYPINTPHLIPPRQKKNKGALHHRTKIWEVIAVPKAWELIRFFHVPSRHFGSPTNLHHLSILRASGTTLMWSITLGAPWGLFWPTKRKGGRVENIGKREEFLSCFFSFSKLGQLKFWVDFFCNSKDDIYIYEN